MLSAEHELVVNTVSHHLNRRKTEFIMQSARSARQVVRMRTAYFEVFAPAKPDTFFEKV